MYRGLYKSKKKKVEFIKLVDPINPVDKDKDTKDAAYKRMTQRGAHLFLDKTLVAQSSEVSKGEFSKLLATIIKSNEDHKRSENKIYDFYSKETEKGSVIKHFYTPKLKDDRVTDRQKKILLTQVVKNKAELNALREYINNRRTDSKLYEKILRNILVKGYKQIPEKNTLTATYGYTFDEKAFMKYNFIIQKETNLQFVLDTLKTNYVSTNDKPKDFLSLSREKVGYKSKSDINLTSKVTENSKCSNIRFKNFENNKLRKLRFVESANTTMRQKLSGNNINSALQTIC
jgi:hypothetical protein